MANPRVQLILSSPARVNEESFQTVEAVYFNETGAAFTPSAARYRVDDLTTRQFALEWTTIATPATSNTIHVTAAQNKIFNPNNVAEKRQITVEATAPNGKIKGTATWDVINLYGTP